MTGSLVVVRAIHYAALLLVAGTGIFSVFITNAVLDRLGNPADLRKALQRFQEQITAWGLVAALISGVLWLLLQTAIIAGSSAPLAPDLAALVTVLEKTQFGQIWGARLLLILLMLLALRAPATRHGLRERVGTILAVLLLISLAWTGHAAATLGQAGEAHRLGDSLHLIAAATWLGGLAALAYILREASRQPASAWVPLAQGATPRFSALGILSVAGLVVTGLVNSWFLVGTLPGLLETTYGRVLLFKLCLFFGMVGLAIINRARLTPAVLERGPLPRDQAAAKLHRNALLELALGAGVLLVVGYLGIIAPAAHQLDHFHHEPMRSQPPAGHMH